MWWRIAACLRADRDLTDWTYAAALPNLRRANAVDADVPRITREMLMAAADAIAAAAPPGEMVPNPLDKALHKSVARAVARVALGQGLNRDDLTGYFD